MNTYKMRKNKKAFSAVIASLILMLIAVAAGVVVYAYVMGWIGGAQTNSANTGIITVDQISANSTSSQIKVYVRNSGSSPVTLDKFYVGGNAVTNATALTTTSAAIPVGGTAYLQFNNQALTVNTSYEVKVVCSDSTQVSQSVVAG
jgi:archaeal type IV pilus assembly protein PilA